MMGVNVPYVIYKYKIPCGGSVKLSGYFHRILKAGEQDGELVLWIENFADATNLTQREVTIHVLGTGWEYYKETGHSILSYVDTVQAQDGLVWHIFAEREK